MCTHTPSLSLALTRAHTHCHTPPRLSLFFLLEPVLSARNHIESVWSHEFPEFKCLAVHGDINQCTQYRTRSQIQRNLVDKLVINTEINQCVSSPDEKSSNTMKNIENDEFYNEFGVKNDQCKIQKLKSDFTHVALYSLQTIVHDNPIPIQTNVMNTIPNEDIVLNDLPQIISVSVEKLQGNIEKNIESDSDLTKKSEKCENIEEKIISKEENLISNENVLIDSCGRKEVTDVPVSMSGGIRNYIQSALQRDFSTVLLPNFDHDKVQDPSLVGK